MAQDNIYNMQQVALLILKTIAIAGANLINNDFQFSNSGSNSSRLLHNLFSDYEAAISPHADLDIPTVVEVGVYVGGFSSVSEITMDYKVTLMLRQSWEDPRLQYSNYSTRPSLSLPGQTATMLWVPDLIFVNEKEGNLHQVTRENRMLRIYRNGTILYSQRITLTVACSMKLHKYPFDKQRCLLEMESFAYTIETLKFVWKSTNALEVTDNLELPHFQLIDSDTTECSKQYYTGDYPCLTIAFDLKRERGYHFIQSYVPSILIVSISWISFWVNSDATAARVSLGVTTVLTMVTMNMAVRSSLPPVSYIKSIDIWTSACLLFVFSALVEFAFVNSCIRQHSKKKPKTNQYGGNVDKPSIELTELTQLNEKCRPSTPEKIMMSIRKGQLDKFSRIAFPVAFLIFNIAYWSTALQS